RQAAEQLRDARREMQQQQEVAARSAPGIDSMAKAMRTLADNTASAADKSNALKTALDALNPARTKGDAIAAHDKALQRVAQSAQEAVDQTKGFGAALLSGDTAINTATENGQALREALLSLVDASTRAVGSGQNLHEVNEKNATAMRQLAEQYGLSAGDIRQAFDQLGGKDIEMIRMAASSGELVQSLGLVARAFDALPDQKEIPFQTGQIAGAQEQLEKLGLKVEEITDKPGYVNVVAHTDAARSRLTAISNLLASDAIPPDKPINVTAPGGKEVFDLLAALGVQVDTDNDKNIDVKAPLGNDVLSLLEQLGVKVRQDNDKLIMVKTTGVDDAKAAIAELTKPENKLIRINTLREAFGAEPLAAAPRADGAIVPMSEGGLRHIIKPSDAGIYQGRGAGTIFAEKETGGEAYIPLANSKRGRSTLILSEVARMFGYQLMENGGITVEQLKQFASGVSGQAYQWGAGNGDTFATDCSGAQSTLANFITGSMGRFSTASQAAGLLSRGFQMGDPPAGISAYWVGWRSGGPGGGHTAGTIVDPTGGDVNIEMGGPAGIGQFGGAAAGAGDFPQRAWIALASGDDPGSDSGGGSTAVRSANARVTSARASVTSAQASLESAQQRVDELKAKGASAEKIATAEKKRQAAEDRLAAAQERQTVAEEKLAEAKEKTPKTAGGGQDGSSLGQSIVSGMLQTLGLDGSLFSNPLEWPNVKSAMALVNFGGNLLKSFTSGDEDGTGGGAGFGGGGAMLPDLTLPGVSGLMNQPKELVHAGTGAAPGPTPESAPFIGTMNVNGPNAAAVGDQLNKQQNAAVRKFGVGRRAG
ncbi:MAG: hypothetical protein M3Y83_18600, partial [Actinomycetota bacterium]|nr:hypothetical protein [Actinomycetota bacterium]